jgi:hypothetical protein
MESGYADSPGGPTAGTTAYGSAGASGEFKPATFFKKPQVILRLIGLVFAVVVFGCISSKGGEKDDCAYGEPSACGYGIFVGVSAFLVLAVFLVTDAIFDNMSNVMHRKYIVIADILNSSVWSFLYFVGFCYLADGWRRNYKASFWGKSEVEAAIAFSFFSFGIFAALTILAVLRYRQGVTEDLSTRPDFGYSSDQYAGHGGGNQSP